MELFYEKIVELNKDQFIELLEFIGKDELKNALIEHAVFFPKRSNYYIGARTTGTFWSGFRKENIPFSRVKKFYVDEALQNKTNINTDFLKTLIERKVSTIDNFSEKYIMKLNPNLCGALCILYGIEINVETQEFLNEISEMTKENDKKIENIINEYEVKIKKMTDDYILKVREYENVINDLKNQLAISENQEKVNKLKLINSVMDYSSYFNLSSNIKELNLENIDFAKKYLINSFEMNKNLINSLEYEKLSKELTIQYIITKIMEEK